MRVRPDVQHIKISDFPRTPWAVSFGLRPALCKVFNYCRQYPDKMESLKALMTFMMQKIGEWERIARTVEFEGGSQRRPMQSATNVRPAQVINTKTGDIDQPERYQHPYSDSIVMKQVEPTFSAHTLLPSQSVPSNELPVRPPMPQMNPNKPGFQVSARAPEPVQAEQQTPTQVATATMSLEEMLAKNAQR